ncbi:hypothetical protein CB1_000094010 [Camelus ferus]|nr:hypothetical protein CB1_000094010 [Camelus ferus]
MDKLPSQPEAVQALWCADSQVSGATTRYGTAELCAHHVTIVAHLIKSCPGECYQLTNLAILLKRLFFFMAPPHQVEFIQKFSPKEPGNLLLWQYISFQALPADLRRQTAREVSRVCTAQCREWLGSSRTVGELESLNTVLSALLTVCSSAGEALDSGQQTAVMEVGSQLWALLNIKLVVTLQTSLLKLEPPDHVRLAVLDFVSSVGKLFIPQAMQTGFVDETADARVERIKQEKGIFWEPFAKVTVEEAKWSSLQPYAKRARHELPVEEEYRAAVQAAAGALGAIESLLQQSVPPDWLLTEMEALHERIDELKRRVV